MSAGFSLPGTAAPGEADAPSPTRGVSARWLIGLLCALMLMVMMALTVTDVVGRYLFNAPLSGAPELTELLLSALIFVGLPAATLDRDHVTVDLLTSNLPRRVERLRAPLAGIASAAVLLAIAWRLWVVGDQIAGYDGTTVTLHIPVAPFAWFAALLTGVSALVALGLAWRDFRRG